MRNDTVLLFTRSGLGHAPAELQTKLVSKYLSLTLESQDLPNKIVLYTEGVRLACEGSPVLEQLDQLEKAGVEIVLCQTCLEYFGLAYPGQGWGCRRDGRHFGSPAKKPQSCQFKSQSLERFEDLIHEIHRFCQTRFFYHNLCLNSPGYRY